MAKEAEKERFCPKCGIVMYKVKRAKGIVYECLNPSCPVIEVRKYWRLLYHKPKIIYDPILNRRWYIE